MQAVILCLFFFNDTATTEIYTLSLHDALPILSAVLAADDIARIDRQEASKNLVLLFADGGRLKRCRWLHRHERENLEERSEEHTSELRHSQISYAVFCLKKKKHDYQYHESPAR